MTCRSPGPFGPMLLAAFVGLATGFAGAPAALARTGFDLQATTFRLPDTAQMADHTPIRGEDAEFAINPPAFRVNGDGTVMDLVTGLEWQQVDGGEMTWERAVQYADALTLGGHSDWRLPSDFDLFNLLDHGATNPALDTSVFPSNNAQYWWAAGARADDPTRIWAANAGGGIGAHPKDETLGAGGTKRFHVRAVRGAYATPADRFDLSVEGLVTDRLTGLTWLRATSPGALTWEQSLVWADALVAGGYDDWRLPNVKELRSISTSARHHPSIDPTAFPGAESVRLWTSTSETNDPTRAWTVDFAYGLVSYDGKTTALRARVVRGRAPTFDAPGMVSIPAGSFVMGDNEGFGGGDHGNDEVPLHPVRLDSFYLARYETTVAQYVAFLAENVATHAVEVREGSVFVTGTAIELATTYPSDPYSRIAWDGSGFAALSGRETHPVTGVYWKGAAAYANWLSTASGLAPCYDLDTGACDFSKTCFRLPTEAEWEYAARGGQLSPYRLFPWGDDRNADGSRANWPDSGDPYESGPYPWTTPVGFYDGSLRLKADHGWPGSQTSYQTKDGSNPYGLFDLSGNVWEWVHDWYGRDYYALSPVDNPTGPPAGSPMPDGKPYRALRGGNWYNGKDTWGHSRVANRNPSYYRGPDDPNHAWYHVGFRVARSIAGSGATGSETGPSPAPGTGFVSAYPNPFDSATRIAYRLESPADIRVGVYDALGRLVAVLETAFRTQGEHFVAWDGTSANGAPMRPGVYFVRLQAGHRADARALVLLR